MDGEATRSVRGANRVCRSSLCIVAWINSTTSWDLASSRLWLAFTE